MAQTGDALFIGGYSVIWLTIAGIFYLIALSGAIVRIASMKSWPWLPAVLLLGPLGTLANGLAGPASPNTDPPYWGSDPWQH